LREVSHDGRPLSLWRRQIVLIVKEKLIACVG